MGQSIKISPCFVWPPSMDQPPNNAWVKLKRLCFILGITLTLEVPLVISPFLLIIENAQRHFQGSLFGCFEYVPYTALTFV